MKRIMSSSIAAEQPFEPFRERDRHWLGLTRAGGTTLRTYAVVCEDARFDRERFEPGVQRLLTTLPAPDWARGRPGAGVLILHQGAGADYLVLGWWDRQNELPLRTWIRYEDGWAPARDDESVCVWDLEILAYERNAWVSTMLSNGQPASLNTYLDHPPA